MIDRRTFVVFVAGNLMAVPGRAVAQPAAKVTRVGFLFPGTARSRYFAQRADAFRFGMRDLGYEEGRNLMIEFRWADDDYDRLPALAAELVALKVDVIVTGGGPATRAAIQATRTIPIVFATVGDAVATGVVADLARPGGNATGTTFFSPELTAKRLELLREAIPSLKQAALLVNSGNSGAKPVQQAVEATAKAMKIGLRTYDARKAGEIEGAMAAMARDRVDALVLFEDGMLVRSSPIIADAALRQRIPAAAGQDFVEAGGMLGYGIRLSDRYREAAIFVDKIWKGAKPGDLPVLRPTKFELVINMKTAKALGVTIPQPMFLRADDVIQ